MRRSDLGALSCVLFASVLPIGCAIPLGPSSGSSTAGTPAPATLPGCFLFQQANPSIGLLQGAGTSLVIDDGSAFWLFGGATLPGAANVTNGLLTDVAESAVAGQSASQCYPGISLATATPAFAASPLGSQYIIAPLDMVEADSAIWGYYELFAYDASAPLGIKAQGTGIAPYDGGSGQFVPTANLLWAGDAPVFGTAAVVEGSDVYAYACTSDANGNQVCYGAHVDAGSIDDPSAYEYAQGAGFYTSDFSQALPILDGPGSLSVRQHSSGRWLATYVRPLDSVVKVRSALTPMGPFSEEYDLFTCQLQDGDFCGGGNQHPEADTGADTIAVSYAAASFSAEGVGNRYWPRLVFVGLPEALP